MGLLVTIRAAPCSSNNPCRSPIGALETRVTSWICQSKRVFE